MAVLWDGQAIVLPFDNEPGNERAFDQATIHESGGVAGAVGVRHPIRRSGDHRFAELTISVDGQSNVASAHRIADQVEGRLRDSLHLDEVTVHVEPC